jgi:kynurenine formamidase
VAGEQAGTHWAAPTHFAAGQAAADELDPGDFFYPAVVLDVRAEVKEDPDFALGVAEIKRWEAEFGPVPTHSALGIDPGADTSFGANRLLLREHRIHLENLAGLGEMPPSGGWIIVGGIRIRGGSGSPATVFGLIP